MVIFNNKEYQTRDIEIPGYGTVTISHFELSNDLLPDGQSYINDEARYIDEGIFYYVDSVDDVMLTTDKELLEILKDVI